MATRSIVPRADGEGSVGTSAKSWGGVWAKKINGAEPNLFYLVRQNSTAYIVGDVAFTPSLPSSFYLKCIAAGTTGASEPTYTSPEVGGTVTDGTVVWQYYDLLSASGTPLGSILPYSANAQTPPHGFLFCEGQAVSRTMYPDLFALIGTTYGAGDGSTTFNLPNMLGRYPQGDTTAGTVKEAGLPNITGTAIPVLLTSASGQTNGLGVSSTSGAITSGEYAANTRNYVAPSGYVTVKTPGPLSFDASRSSAIYGNSDTVTPPTLTVRWIIKAYDAPTPSSAQVDLSKYASDLANRLTREQTPAFNRRDVITTSGTYTAPVTGWYKITVKGGGGGGQGSYASSYNAGGNGGGEGGLSIGWEHLNAGDTVAVVIGAGGAGGAVHAGIGTNGGNTTVTANNNSYIGYGGKCPAGGAGTISGAPGGAGIRGTTGITTPGGTGGGNGGGTSSTAASDGGGGVGGTTGGSGEAVGGAGGNGYAWFELFDPSLM